MLAFWCLSENSSIKHDFPLKINIEINKRPNEDRLIVTLRRSAQSEWSNKPFFNTSCAINSHVTCHVQDLILNPLRSSCEGWQRIWIKLREAFSIIPLQTAVPIWGFSSSFACLFYSSRCWYSWRAAVFIISHIVSCHSEVSGVDNQANHEAGGEQFFCALGLARHCRFLCSLIFSPVGHFWAARTLQSDNEIAHSDAERTCGNMKAKTHTHTPISNLSSPVAHVLLFWYVSA